MQAVQLAHACAIPVSASARRRWSGSATSRCRFLVLCCIPVQVMFPNGCNTDACGGAQPSNCADLPSYMKSFSPVPVVSSCKSLSRMSDSPCSHTIGPQMAIQAKCRQPLSCMCYSSQRKCKAKARQAGVEFWYFSAACVLQRLYHRCLRRRAAFELCGYESTSTATHSHTHTA